MADLTPSTAVGWFTVVSTLSGFITGWLTEWFRDERARKREREAAEAISQRERDARSATRREQRFERRTSFQRQTLLDLQDSTQRLLRATGRMHHLDSMAFRSGEKWHGQLYPDDLDSETHAANVQTMKLASRVRDASIRSTTEELRSKCISAMFSRDEAEGDRLLVDAGNMFGALNKRIGEQLRQLDDDENTPGQ
jgi:hypothetical protein